MSLDKVRIGFIPLVDAAVPIVAAEVGFGAAEGLEIELTREVSWANIRDRLTLGHFDAAHLLAPMAIATTLGLNTIRTPLVAPITLGLNGNAVTLAPRLHDEVMERMEDGADLADPRATGAAFAAVVRARRAHGDEPPTLGMTFPFSTHNYQLRLWLAAAGLRPDEDVRLAVVPPPYMVDALVNAHVEGFCVGAPWNSVAVELGLGRILHLGVDLVRRCPEKVLAMRGSFLERGDLVARLVRACAAAARWLDDRQNHGEAAAILAARERLDAPVEIIRRTFDGRLPTGWRDVVRTSDRYILFAREDASRPDPRHAQWLFGEMVRWGQTSSDPEAERAAVAVYRPDLYDAALGRPSESLRTGDPLGLAFS
ncbi:CmpA/NrtA family ABC transporter substrate-binding protein [Hansschlegelia zhihuaiae]|uniref:Nitrate transporter n=1 Tax=Hansschlegelia zhihuaiae TaxID=405005 RepID=A0A4Q0MPG3_9HYPH|nr:CmpA/NrtA family ABC transporter substrate-binding protein [Hansschlegelia zhihuaiae]RXF75664.1 nitrate transporter [Hansschlegelia zhihuaiae]